MLSPKCALCDWLVRTIYPEKICLLQPGLSPGIQWPCSVSVGVCLHQLLFKRLPATQKVLVPLESFHCVEEFHPKTICQLSSQQLKFMYKKKSLNDKLSTEKRSATSLSRSSPNDHPVSSIHCHPECDRHRMLKSFYAALLDSRRAARLYRVSYRFRIASPG